MGSSTSVNCFPSQRPRRLQPLQIFGQRRMVRIVRIRLNAGHNRRRPNEPRNIVHMPMRIVAHDSRASQIT
jgi:hypothetical protein